MWSDDEKREVMEAMRRIETSTQELENAVFGDDRSGRDGLIKDMKVVHAFILKWDKREFAVRWIAAIAGSNLLLTLLGFVLMIYLASGG